MMSCPRLATTWAVMIVLSAAATDGWMTPRRSSCRQPTNKQPIYGIRTPSLTPLMNLVFQDPWLDRHDLWRDPFDWGHHFLPRSLSNRPWEAGLSLLGSSLSADGISKINCQRHQDSAATGMNSQGIKSEGEHRQKVDPGCQRGEAENQQETRDRIREERQQQQMEKQRRDQEARLRRQQEEEEELRRRQDERRVEEERRWRQLREEEEAARRQRDLWEEEQRIKKEARERQEREASERRTREEQAKRRRRMQEQKAAEERKRGESSWSYPRQGMKDNISNRHGSSRQNQHQHFRHVEVASLNIPGYTPEDLSVTTSGNRLVVEGKHVCDCREKCTEREFKRGFEIPRNVDPDSLEAKLVHSGRLSIGGKQYSTRVQPAGEAEVPVEGDGSFSPRIRNVDPTCGGRRTGFKLKKLNKQTGEIVEDAEDLVQEIHGRTFEDEVDEDGITMEVEY